MADREHCVEHEERSMCIAHLKTDVTYMKWFYGGICAMGLFIIVTLMNLTASISDVKADMRVLMAEVKAETRAEMQNERVK